MTILNFAAGIASDPAVRSWAWIVIGFAAAWSVSYVIHRAIGLVAAFGGGEADTRNPNEVTR